MGKHKAKGDSIEGIPFPGGDAMAQTGEGVRTNRDEPTTAFNPLVRDDTDWPNDYLVEEPQRLAEHRDQDWVKDNREWSEGIADEENDAGSFSFGDLDRQDDDEAPEAVPND